MIHIANIVLDEKFVDDIITLHSLTNDVCVHHYFLMEENFSGKFKYIDKNRDEIIVLDSFQFIKRMSGAEYSAVFLHSLYALPLLKILQIPSNIKVFWFAWGYDIYGENKLIPINLYGHKTNAFLYSTYKLNRFKKVREYLHQFLFFCRHGFLLEKLYMRAVQRIDYFSGVLPVEFQMAKRNPYFRAEEIMYSYGNSASFNCKISNGGTNWLIGNSADPSNNHLDLFDFLKLLDIKGRKIYVPLSYGGNQKYIEEVIRVGESLWGEDFVPLTQFVPKEEYLKIVDSCGFACFFHERQQAIGNIEMALRNGCKVFLSNTSVAYKHYKQIGVGIYTVQEDLKENNIQPLSYDLRTNNIDKINSFYSDLECKNRLISCYRKMNLIE